VFGDDHVTWYMGADVDAGEQTDADEGLSCSFLRLLNMV